MPYAAPLCGRPVLRIPRLGLPRTGSGASASSSSASRLEGGAEPEAAELPPPDDLAAWSVAQLRAYLQQRSLRYVCPAHPLRAARPEGRLL